MRLIGKQRLCSIYGINSEIDVWISAWVAEISNASWCDSEELVEAFPTVRAEDRASYCFPICGDKGTYIKMAVCFHKGIAVISEVIIK
jgi:mRNA-degrading endonuclease HigB of HigAB toxin-antitoxin module